MKKYVKEEDKMENVGLWKFGKLQAGAAIALNLIDRDFCYVVGGMDSNRGISKKCIQVRYSTRSGVEEEEQDINCVRMLQDLPEPRIHHSAICMRGMLIVTGGLSSMSVDMQFYTQVPCS